MNSFHANGKLLISGEYVVLDGGLALAIPTKKGQFLHFEPTNHSILHWKNEIFRVSLVYLLLLPQAACFSMLLLCQRH